MPKYFEDAANILLLLTRGGLRVRDWVDARYIVARLAYLMLLHRTSCRDLSCAGAARWIIDDLRARKYIRWSIGSRPSVEARLSAALADFHWNQMIWPPGFEHCRQRAS